MNQTKLILLILLLIFSNFIYCQNSELLDIKLTIKHSQKIPYNSTEIILNYRGTKRDVKVKIKSTPLLDSEKWKYSQIDTLLTISHEQYAKMVASIKEIKQSDIYGNLNSFGIDGYTCNLEFGNPSNSISYKMFAPSNNTEERNLINYLKVCELIIESVNLNPKQILGNGL